MMPLEVGGRQQGLEHGGDHDDELKRLAEKVQQLVRLVLLIVRPDVVDKCRVLLPHFGSCGGNCERLLVSVVLLLLILSHQ